MADLMTASSITGKHLIKPFIVAVLLLCLCLAILVLPGIRNEIALAPLEDSRWLSGAIATQVFASLLFIFAWQSILRLQSQVNCSFAECSAHIGVTLLGKYLPGKVWGLLGRSYLLTRRGLSSGMAMNLLLADQFVTFYTGTLLGIAALITFYQPSLAILFIICFGCAFPLSLRFLDRIMDIASSFLRAIANKTGHSQITDFSLLNYRYFYIAFAAYCAHWLMTAAVLGFLFYPQLSDDPVTGFTIIAAAIPLAMLLGFLAVWAPGGIGVREGTIVAILALHFPVDFAISIAIYYRMLCVAIDLSIGAFATFYLLKTVPLLLIDETVER